MKLLAIDDNRDNLTTLKAVLADRLPEARLLTALSGPRGIELAQAEDPDVILLDIVMPGMDGYAVCRALKQDELLRSIPVLFLTALRTDRESRIKALEAGAEGFLSKPFDEVELTAQIRAMTKIKAANRMQRQEKEELAALVAERTRDLEQELEARKRTEEVLKASEDRFHGIFLGHDAIMLLIDPKTGAIRDANPAAVHFYGYTTEQLLQMTIEEINVLAAGEIARQRAMAQEQKQNYFVFPHRLANGEIRTIEVHSSPITVRDETLLFSIIHDVTERKQSEEAVKREQLFSKAIIDSIPGAFYVLDERGRYARWNAYERDEIIGKPEGEIASLSAIETVHPDDRERVQERIVKVIKNGAAETLEARVLLRGGPAFRWLLLTGRQMVIDGHPFVVGLGIDIAPRKQAEEDLRSEDQRLQFIIDGSRLGTWVWNVQTNQTQFNETWAAMIGYRSSELMPYSYGTWEALVHPDDLAVAAERLRRCVAGETTDYECEFRMRHKDGHWVWILDRGRIMTHDAAGAPLSMFGTHLDITERKRTEAALGESELVFRNLANAVPQIVWMTDAEGLNNYFNQQWVAYTGLTLEESYGHGWILPFHPDDRQRAWEAWQNATNTAGVYALECRLRRADGDYRWWLIRGTALQDAAGKVVRWFGTCTDIDDLKRIELQLQLAASVFGHAQEGIAITAVDGTILAVNDSFTRITGYAREEAIGQNPRILKSGRHGPEFYAAMWQALTDKGQWYGELWNRRKNGEVFPEMLGITAVRAADGTPQHYVGLFSDITAIKEHEERLVYLAHYDALTSLPNRRLLADRLQQAMAQTQRRARRHARSLAVLYLDLDGFKGVNDQHGHEIGDQLLVVIAQRMGAVLREGDTLARFGGDEFIAVLMDLEQPRDGEGVITRLLTAVADPVTIGAAELQVSASIGVTFFPQDQADADQLLRHADQAMYVAKQSGKNSYHIFDIAQDTAVKSRHASLERIRLALDRREFILYYQPKVNLRTGTVIGAEALVRWRHPESGLLRPTAFLPVIENHPLGVELGDWVLATALTQIANWRAQGFDLPISVNIGVRQLQQLDFMPRLRERLAACPRIPPDRLELEILESSALGDIAQVTRTMLAVRELGVRFAIDDFGTGYSSLTYLKRLPADMIKIDQSFVRDMLDDPEDLAIIDGVIGLATAFGREVIAEGVESAAHGELLLLMGCTLAQGYYIALPMPAEDLPGWSRIWRPAASWLAPTTGASGRELFPVLLAITHHRAWIGALEACLTGSASTPPPPDEHHCHFGAWLEGEGRTRWGTHRGFQESLATHHRLHCLAEELLTWHARGETAAARNRLGELRALSDDLTGALRALIRGGNPPAESPASGDE
jgi:diguanylate cyclase (GGDEF)-like protein/PAS domain S-box-containing protein